MNAIAVDEAGEVHYRWLLSKHRLSGARRALLIRRFCSASRFQRKLAQMQAIREFEALDDYYLEDIGIERFQIKEFVHSGNR